MNFNIAALDDRLVADIKSKIDHKTKPLGALGQLEKLAAKIAQIQGTLTPKLSNPAIAVFAGDHGVAKEGVSAYPQEVTHQMVLNFIHGGAAINVFARQHNIKLKVVDAGVNHDFTEDLPILHAKIAKGTRSFLSDKAMTDEACQMAISAGAKVVKQLHEEGTNVIGFGEMGIGNTSASALIMSTLCDMHLIECVGRGTGLTDEQYHHKLSILQNAKNLHQLDKHDVIDVLTTFGGFEIAMICGGMLQAAELGMIILVDGFIASSAFLCAFHLDKNVKDYAIFCHQSEEQGHRKLLDYLDAEPILNLGMRLGEGTGCAVAYPILVSAVNFLNEMASFESAGVTDKAEE
ncbi:MAG: nicotinate-nucleotide--dimethylbenzimidazole phosphoribosyltransferase [Bacteroidota bacterium]